MESFRKDLLEKAVGHALHFCQDNQAQSTYGVIRGLHYQMPPHALSKLVSVPQGEVLDVVVDIRKGSPRFGKHLAIDLSSKNQPSFLQLGREKCGRFFQKSGRLI